MKNHIKFIISPLFMSIGCICNLPAVAAPGVPADPLVVWSEDFQNLPTPTLMSDVTDLLGYAGLNPVNQAYTADPPWTSPSKMCNGILAAYNQNPNSTVGIAACTGNKGSWNFSQQLSQALGILRGQDINTTSRNNYAVTAFTTGDPGSDLIILRTEGNIPLVASKRFLLTSIDAAALNCQSGRPLLRFSFVDQDGIEENISPDAVDVCANGSRVPVSALESNLAGTAVAGILNSPAAFKFAGRSVGYIIRNAQGSGNGNDFAFDNPKILDATPQLDNAFDPPLVAMGNSINIVFTITNTSDLLAKEGWVFTDTLSPGLTVSGVPITTCPTASTDVLAPIGANSISITSSLSNGMASCTITVPVMASTAGIYQNNENNISLHEFINPPLPNTSNHLEVTPAADMQASSSLPANVIAGQTVAGTIACLNAGPSAADSATCDISGLPAGATTSCTPAVPTATPLTVSGAISCDVSFVAPATGSITATITAGSATADPLTSNNAVSYNAVITPAADMQASSLLPANVTAGQTVTGTIACLNAGPSAADSATCDISGLPAGATTSCTPAVPTATPLTASSAISCDVSFVAPATGSMTATITAGSATADPLPANNAVSYNAVITPAADMQASSLLPANVTAGQTVAGTIACLNAGPSAADSATCGISGLPAGATTSCTPAVPTATPLTVSGAISCDVSFVAPATGSMTATITAGSATADPLTSNNAVSYNAVITPAADMQASSSLPANVTAGQTVAGIMTCLNAGPSAADSATCGISGLPAGATTSCTPTVPTATPLPASSAISCNVSFVAPATGSMTATITAGSATPDPESANNAISYEASINTQPIIKRVPALNHWMIFTLSFILGVAILVGFRKKMKC
ncbi:hypothetical protein [Comamonas sp. 23]|uniref:DUF7933 domain-containing protein n=1 Tax=Comamonas sp. 23 TaxID=3415008 RepID=UPI003C6FE770